MHRQKARFEKSICLYAISVTLAILPINGKADDLNDNAHGEALGRLYSGMPNALNDTEIHNLLRGKWQNEDCTNVLVSYGTNGTFQSIGWSYTNNCEIHFEGTCEVKNGNLYLICVKSNSIPFVKTEIWKFVYMSSNEFLIGMPKDRQGWFYRRKGV